MSDTVTVWPQSEPPLDWDMVNEFDDTFNNRNQAILEAMHWRLLIENVLGNENWWAKSDARQRRMAIRQAVIDSLSGD